MVQARTCVRKLATCRAFVTFPFTSAPAVYSAQVFEGIHVEPSPPLSDFDRLLHCILYGKARVSRTCLYQAPQSCAWNCSSKTIHGHGQTPQGVESPLSSSRAGKSRNLSTQRNRSHLLS